MFNFYNCGMPRIHEHIKVEKCCNVYVLYEVKNVKLPNSFICNKQGKSKAKRKKICENRYTYMVFVKIGLNIVFIN